MAQHKYAGTGLVGRTSMTVSDVLRMAEATAATQESDFFRGIGPVAVTTRSAAGLELMVMGGLGNKFKQLAFVLSIGSAGEDRQVRTKITSYRTSQNTVAGFIPVGPKTMLGFKSYELFIIRLARTLREADASTDIGVSSSSASPSSARR